MQVPDDVSMAAPPRLVWLGVSRRTRQAPDSRTGTRQGCGHAPRMSQSAMQAVGVREQIEWHNGSPYADMASGFGYRPYMGGLKGAGAGILGVGIH